MKTVKQMANSKIEIDCKLHWTYPMINFIAKRIKSRHLVSLFYNVTILKLYSKDKIIAKYKLGDLLKY